MNKELDNLIIWNDYDGKVNKVGHKMQHIFVITNESIKSPPDTKYTQVSFYSLG